MNSIYVDNLARLPLSDGGQVVLYADDLFQFGAGMTTTDCRMMFQW